MLRLAAVKNTIVPNSVPLLTVEEVRQRLNYRHPGSIRRLFQRGDLPGVKLNARTLRFRQQDVDRFINDGAAAVATAAGG